MHQPTAGSGASADAEEMGALSHSVARVDGCDRKIGKFPQTLWCDRYKKGIQGHDCFPLVQIFLTCYTCKDRERQRSAPGLVYLTVCEIDLL